MKKITSFILFFIVVFLVAGGKLEAQIKKGFQPRFSEAVKGNVTLIANNVLSRNKTTSYIGSDGNHDFSNNVFVDIDSDASTFNSSSANLSNPEPTVSCLSIKKAYLYWAAADKEEDNSSDEPNWDYNKVKLQLPGSLGYTTITADDVIYRGRDEIGHFVNDPYICFKDITSEVKALATPYGTYQVANVRAKEGSLTSHGGGNTGTSGGWQIVFVYESPTLPAKNISLFDGYAHVTSSVNNFEIGFSGFQTVPTGDVDVDVVIGALEGDRDLSGDRLQIKNTSNNWVDLSYSLRSSSNFFNSRIAKNGSNFIDRNPASTNTLGFDADVFALSNPGNSIIANNQTSATIRLTSNQETYGLFLIGLSVDVWKPDLAPLILSSSTNTSSVEDTVSFSVNIENNGNDNVKDLTIETTIPQEVDLIEPIIGLPFGVTYSYNTTTRLLTFDAIDGITDVGDTPYSLSFQVKVKKQCYFLEEMCSDKFQIQLIATYAGEENNSTQTTLSSKSVDSCGIGDNLPNEISINQPDEANWTTTVNSLDRTVSCEDSAALATAQLLTPEASCDLTITKIPGSFEASTTNCPVIGTYTNIWTFTDSCGRTSGQFTQTITVTDTSAPVLSATPADVSVDCEAIPAVPTITATDNCDSVVDVVFTEVSNTVVDGCGEIVRQWESTDNCGNTVSHTQTITVTDTTAPVLSAEPADVSVDCETIPSVPTITATDNCDSVVDVVFTEVSNTVVDGCGEIVRQWESTDNCGNTVSHTQTITVTDTTAPVLSATPADVSVDCEAIPSVPTITATDNCDSVVDVVFTEVSNTVVDGCGEIVRQWESTDNCGNTVSHTQTITVTDITNPDFTVPVDITIYKNDNCTYDVSIGITGDVTNESDNCDTTLDASYSDVESAGTCEGEVIVTRTWSLTDNCGNTTEKVQTITVKDNTAPIIDETNKNNIDIECGVGDTETTLQDWLNSNAGATATDNCSSVIWTNNYGDDTSVKCDGSYITVTFTATDACGNFSTTTAGYLIKDETAPTITQQPSDKIVECDGAGNITELNSWLATNGGATATDDCSIVTWSNDYTGLTYTCSFTGEVEVVFTAKDACGNTVNTTSAKFTIEDTVAPEFVETLPAAEITVSCDNIPVMETLTATDNCDASVTVIPSEVTSGDDDTCGSEYLITRKWTVSDCSGNTTTHIQVITVEDTVAPEFVETLPTAEITVSCDNIPVMETLTATDNCDASVTVIPSEVTSGDDDACGSEYLITRKWTVSDCSGNTTTHIQVITVEDTVAPEFVETLPAAEITVSCDNIPVMETLTATDNCDASVTVIPSEVTSGDDDACGSEYLITRKWIVSDCSGNTTTHIQVITVEDTTAPEFVETLPAAEITVSCDNIPVMETLTATDNCDASVMVIPSEVTSGDDDACGSEYLITRKWTVSDCSGNTTTHIQVIAVEDTVAPEFVEELPADATVSCDTIPAAAVLTATDNCDTSVTVNYSEEFSGQDYICASEYTITRTWAVQDCAGNSTSHTQVVTVEDTTAPEFVEELPADAIVSCDTIPTAVILTATDNCDASVTVNYSEEFSGQDDACASEYTVTRTWTVEDCAGNETSHTQVVTVEDTQAPEFVEELPADVTVSCDTIPTAVILTATDNCDTSVTVNYSEEFSGQDNICASEYTVTRTWAVEDCAGNEASHTQVITIEDNEAPQLVSTLEDIIVECDTVPDVPTLEFTDNCSSNVTQTNFEETSTFDGSDSDYTITRKWTVTDDCGNVADFIQYITVTVKTSVTEIADSRCIDDGEINLNDYLANQSENGTWEVTQGSVTISNDGSFDPSGVNLGDYVFTYTSSNSSCLTATKVTININDDCIVLPCGQEDVVISKAVTPNGDSWNEFFKVTGAESCGFIANVKIFNRWGARVFESKNYANNWNGTSDGATFGSAERLPAGTYYYIVILENSGLKPFTGAIYLGTK
nr:hypothetical protein BACT7_26500 [Tenacibaculum mesophilum]